LIVSLPKSILISVFNLPASRKKFNALKEKLPTRRKLANSVGYILIHFQARCKQWTLGRFKIRKTTLRATPDSKACTLLYF
jgi:hypothetical protein